MRERRCKPVAVPAHIKDLIGDCRWSRNLVGMSGAALYRLSGIREWFLKCGRGRVAKDLVEEMARQSWLAQHVSVPAIQGFAYQPGSTWLLMDTLPGRTAYQIMETEPESREAVVEALAQFLLRLHAIPLADCPFTSRYVVRMAHAEQRLKAGLVDTEDFDAEHASWSAHQLWAALTTMLPLSEDLVVTHGDYSLDNMLLMDGVVQGCIDLGRVGVADRYQDLAILWNCLGEFGPSLQTHLLKCYGIAQPDLAKLRFHLMLDEFF